MGNITGAGGTTTSLSNTPQAGDDSYRFWEDQLLANSTLYDTVTETLYLNVMSNDLGGKAKSLFSISAEDGTPIDDLTQTDLLSNSKNSTWEKTTDGNWIRIFNGKIEYRLADSQYPNDPDKARDVNSLGHAEIIDDSFVYAIKLGNGTLSWATVRVTITGQNDGPAANADIGSAGENQVKSFDVLANDTDADAGDTKTLSSLGSVTVTSANEAVNGIDASGAFSIVAGQIRINPGSLFDALDTGDTATVTIAYTMKDSHGVFSSSTLTLTINGVNDAPTTGDDTASTDEDSLASGSVADNTSDPDDTVLSFSQVGAPLAGLTFNADGTWSFDPAGGFEGLDTGESTTVSFQYKANDGEADSNVSTVTITIEGVNDAPVIDVDASDKSGSVEEDTAGADIATGQILASDVDGTVLEYTVVGSSAYGTFSVDANGVWTFELDNTLPATQALAAGASLTETFTVAVKDQHGLTSLEDVDVKITVNGTNDPAVIAGDTSGIAVEAGGVNNGTAGSNATGDLDSTDVDNADDAWNAIASPTASASGYGSFTIDASGHWIYTVNQNNAAVQALNVGGSLNDSFTVSTGDGTTQVVNVTIQGANDAATIGGQLTGSVTEDATLTATGSLSAADVDNPANVFAAVTTATASNSGYGTFTMTAGGSWTFTLNNALSAVQALNTGQSLADSFTVTSADGTSQVISVTINGADDIVVPTPTDLILTVTTIPSGNNLPSGGFAQVSVANPFPGATYTYSATSLTATDLAGNAVAGFAGDFTVSSAGVVTATSTVGVSNVDSSRIYELTVRVDGGANPYSESFTIITGSNQGENLADGSGFATGDDVIYAVGGADVVFAGSGNDTVFGQAAGDDIHGGLGNDILVGAAGDDDFFFDTALNDTTNVDIIRDFSANGGSNGTDKIILDDAIFGALGLTVTNDEIRKNAGGNAVDGNDFILFDTNTGNLYYDADGSGGTFAKVLFAQLDLTGLGGGVASLEATDFLIG